MLIEDYFLGDWRDKVSDVSYEKFVEAMATYDDSSSTFDVPTPLDDSLSTFAAPTPVVMKR